MDLWKNAGSSLRDQSQQSQNQKPMSAEQTGQYFRMNGALAKADTSKFEGTLKAVISSHVAEGKMQSDARIAAIQNAMKISDVMVMGKTVSMKVDGQTKVLPIPPSAAQKFQTGEMSADKVAVLSLINNNMKASYEANKLQSGNDVAQSTRFSR